MHSNVSMIFDDGSAEMKSGLYRDNYSTHHSKISYLADLKATLRAGEFTSGGYPLYFETGDGETWSFEGVRKNWRTIARDWMTGCGPRPERCLVNYESELRCELTGEEIPSAYDVND